ncbi:MAG: alpha/beta fold hydrolase, partial [Actinobacteria bacterium]|nr:alpha/beta fold hydrolase [Actinomycetota bacterium]
MKSYCLVLACLVLSACGATSERTGSEPVVPERTAPHASTSKGQAVTFPAADGIRLAGRTFGEGRVGVVMAHMDQSGDTQADWYPLARVLAARGYAVLTYNRRGVCTARGRDCSNGSDEYASSWKDVAGASAFVRSRGATRVALVGASIGAMSALHARITQQVDADALIEIGGVNHASGYDFSRKQLNRLDGAKLFIS